MTGREYQRLFDEAAAATRIVHDPYAQLKKTHARYVAACEVATGFKPDDRVELVAPPPLTPAHGWWSSRETFRPGALGLVVDVGFNEFHRYFHVDVVWDVERWTYEPGEGKPSEVRVKDTARIRHTYAMDPKYLRHAATPGAAP